MMVDPDPADAPVIPPVMVPMVQLKVLAALEVKLIFGPVPEQILAVVAEVMAGVGFTVTVMAVAFPTQLPVVEVGVTLYTTEPAVELLGLVRVWLINDPEPADDPVIPPVMVPMVQAKVLAALEVRLIFGPVPEQVLAVDELVTAGFGLTVTVMAVELPGQLPVVEVGVTLYTTDPAAELLGLVRVWLMLLPDPEEAPVIPPVMVPMVQLKVLAVLAVRLMFGPVPEQTLAVVELVTDGVGLTVTVMAVTFPGQLPVVEVGVTLYTTDPAVELLGLVRVWLMLLPDPEDAPVIPPVIVPMVQVKVLAAEEVKLIFGPVPEQMVAVVELVTAGFGFTVTVMANEFPVQRPPVEVGTTLYTTDPAVELLGLVRT